MSFGRFNHFNPYPGPARAGMRRCPAPKPPPCPVVVIDEDDGGDDASDSEVFIIEAPRCWARKRDSSSGNVIDIDDDEDVEEGAGWDKAGPSTSRASSGSPVSSTPGRGSPGNRYGFGSTSYSSDSDLSEWSNSDTDDGGSSDCEIMAARELWETAASRKKMPRARSEARPDKSSEGPFGAGCNLNETYFSTAWKGDTQNNTGGTKEGPECAQSSARDAKDDHGPSSVPSTKECSNGKVGKGTEGFQSPCPDGIFVPANRVFFGNSSGDRKYGSPPISVSTPEKVDEKIPEGVYSEKDQSPPEPYGNTDTYSAQCDGSVRGQQKEAPPFTSRCDCSKQFEENYPQAQANLCACEASGRGSLPLKDLIHDPEEPGQFASVQCAPVIGDREKHKESIEYKRAAEEEWASRQRQLQLQAEEAKKMRKRKKAEAQRLLDMEKRQKQRLQEVRESQRKNEEAIQLKEKYRGEVRKELEDMERRYWDMTSIFRALGVPVEGGEVKAYKQALLKFHPDRVSRNDMYQQVKAEETFKFISRLKEKLTRFP
ncbi:unnamed protein product [Urochloa decumbens]|uniref:J domain-containing protein n=2 Tax=Urochloa decumbens TaxID=240449 RepID=A0ABC8X0X8_9POAL